MADAQSSDIIIVIMGLSGVGNSAFINIAAATNATTISDGLNPCTAELKPIVISHPSDPIRRIVLLDTPGFNGAYDNSKLLKLVHAWLTCSYGGRSEVTGIVYLHDIYLSRDVWSRTFIPEIRKLCGKDAINKIILVTTKWSVHGDVEQQKREQRLFGTSNHIGTRVARFHRTRDSAWSIIDLLIGKRPTNTMVLGAGKSTFINTAAGNELAPVGNDMETCTTNIKPVFVPHPTDPTRRIIFVDTPGFIDVWVNDREILKCIIEWLEPLHNEGVDLSGIIYLHEITHARCPKETPENLLVPNKLRSPEAVKNVVLATAKWNGVAHDVDEQRERQLQASYWKEMIDKGSQTARYLNTHDSAWEIVDRLLQEDRPEGSLIHQELTQVLAQLPKKPEPGFVGGFLTFIFGRGRKQHGFLVSDPLSPDTHAQRYARQP
ncbi:hypothetical protein BV22DRAFT_1129068 [Leucogyrophana mollusca]|uniref:Uncharacterized protein n=1 Tax=Leucogyrophana mollusca TaxID=85980 RepID=A0ACB8BIZ0_9AGAM|nr:hypothetical protein BV22DRAFT_1129068 [Leucogyrophana mollusca]